MGNISILASGSVVSNGQLLDAALSYSKRGWSIIPVIGKRATGPWKPFQSRPADKKTLHRLVAKDGITGLAVILGQASGSLAVRDFDRPDAYDLWAKSYPDDAALLPTVKTARGYHVYGHLDHEAYAVLRDGELRADSGHYVLLPPSHHPDGTSYRWVNPLPDGELLGLPRSLLGTLDHTVSCEIETQANPSKPSKHIACASSADDVAAVIAKTLPNGPGQRNRRLFELARHLKAIMPTAPPDELRRIVREWHGIALPFIRTKDFSESWADFAIAWERVKRPAGCSFRAAVHAAKSAHLPAIAKQYDGNLRQLVALCLQLQGQWGDRPFPLSCRKAGEHLGVSPVQAWRLLRALQFDRVVHVEKKGTKASGKASEWRFIAQEPKAALLGDRTLAGDHEAGPYAERF